MKFFQNAWWVVVAAVIGQIVSSGPLLQFSFGVFLKPLADEFGADRATLSFAVLVAFTAIGFSSLAVGRLIDRYGIRLVVLSAIVLFALSVAALGLSPSSPYAFIALYGIAGLFGAGQSPPPYAKAVAASFDTRRGLALGIAMTGVGLGAILLPQLAQFLIANMGWRNAYIALSIVILVIAFPVVYLLLRDPVAAIQTKKEGEIAGVTGKEAVRSPQFWFMIAVFFALVCVSAGVIAHIVPILTDRGISAQVAAGAISAAGAALIVGRLGAGYLLDRIFAPYVAFIFVFLSIVGLGLLLLPATPGLAIAATICIGLALGAEVDLIGFMIPRYFGFRSFGEIYGYMFSAFTFGSGLGPFAMGLSFSLTGSYTIAILGLGAALLLSSLLFLLLGPYRYDHLVRSDFTTPVGLKIEVQNDR